MEAYIQVQDSQGEIRGGGVMELSYVLFILNDDLERAEDDLKNNRFKVEPREKQKMINRKQQLKKAIHLLEEVE